MSHRQVTSLLDCEPTRAADAVDTAALRVPLRHNVWMLQSEGAVVSLDLPAGLQAGKRAGVTGEPSL